MAIANPIVQNASQAVAAARFALTEALVLKVGQVLEAVVVGKTSDGLATLKIGDQVVVAKLPQLDVPVGGTLQLQVKSTGSSPQLQVVSAASPAQGLGKAPAEPAAALPSPSLARSATLASIERLPVQP